MPSALEPLRLRRFRRLFGAYGINATGDWLGEIALSVLLLHAGGGVLGVGALFVFARFMPALIAPFAATVLCRRGPGRLLAALHAAEAVLYGVLALAILVGASAVALLVLAAIDGVLAVVARGLIKAAIVAETRPAGLLREGNTLINALFTGAMAAGPVAGGVVVATAGVPTALALDAMSFAVAAALLAPFTTNRDKEPRSAPLSPLRHGLGHIRRHPALRRLLTVDGGTAVFLASIVPVELIFVTETLGGTEAGFGAVLAAWGIGAVAGGATLPALRTVPLLALVVIGMLLIVVSYVGMGTAHTLNAVLAFSAIGGVGNGIEGMALVTAIQEHTPDRLQDQVNTLIESLHTAAPGAGYALGTAVAAAASPRTAYVVAAIGALAVLLAAASSPAGGCRTVTRLFRERRGGPAPGSGTATTTPMSSPATPGVVERASLEPAI